MRKIFFSIFSLFIIFGMFAGCSSDKQASENLLRLALAGEMPGFDPAAAGDTISVEVQSQIMEPLLQYSYLKRPYQLEPLLAEAMPQVSADRLTYTIKIKKGVFFQDDPAFKATGGKGRELVADDFIYQIKRLADVHNKSSGWSFFDGRISGLDKFRDYTKKTNNPDYRLSVAGLKAVDRYTLQVRLTEPYPQLLYILAMPYVVPVPYEVAELYKDELLNHPVGTGPYKFDKWVRNSQIILIKNPGFRKELYPSEGETEDRTNGNLVDAGKELPLMEKVQFTFILEDQPLWLNFMKGKLDFGGIPKDNYDRAVTKDRELTPEMAKKGIVLRKSAVPSLGYIGFNMQDPVVGKNKYLRQAMCLAFDHKKDINLFSNDRAIQAQMIIPPDFEGYDPDYIHPYGKYDLKKAAALLEKAGFPGGKGLPVLEFSIGSTDSSQRQFAEFFVKQMALIGIQVKVNPTTWPQFLDALNKKSVQIYALGWNADYPDAENFLQLLYGPNAAPGNNHALYNNPAYNASYDKVKVMASSPERSSIYRQMALMINEDCPWLLMNTPISFSLRYQWVHNSKRHFFANNTLKYIRIDTKQRAEMLNGKKEGQR